jgi:hypothetical protein
MGVAVGRHWPPQGFASNCPVAESAPFALQRQLRIDILVLAGKGLKPLNHEEN